MLNINSLIYLIKTQQAILLETLDQMERNVTKPESGVDWHGADIRCLKRIVQAQNKSLEAKIDSDLSELYQEYKRTLETNKMELEGSY